MSCLELNKSWIHGRKRKMILSDSNEIYERIGISCEKLRDNLAGRIILTKNYLVINKDDDLIDGQQINTIC